MSKTSNEILYYENIIKECKQYLKESGELQEDRIIKWANALLELGMPKSHVSSAMRGEAKKEFGWKESKLNYISEVLSEYNHDLVNSNMARSAEQLGTLSVEDQITKQLEVIEEKLEKLPASRKQKVLNSVSSFVKQKAEKKTAGLDVGIHQAEPPKDQQGESEFSQAVGLTAQWFEDAGARFRKIQSEIEIYKPDNPQERADSWNSTINSVIIGEILHPIFMTETKAEADRKYSTSIYHWIRIIEERIRQSKHGAGKKSENYITDPLTGKPVYNKKGKPIKRGNTRERVGDFERPIVIMAQDMIKANAGMITLHDWLENVQGGHRRYRKEILHDYFSEAATGSIKSGNPEYEQYMEEYKKKQKEKYAST